MLARLSAAALFATAAFGASAVPASAETAIFAGGCFWCVESDFDHVEGVTETVSGYIGGENENPTYQNHPGHREVVRIEFDPSKVSYETLVEAFFRSVDPVDEGGQFCDRGHSYTTGIYATSEEQAETAREVKARSQEALGQEIVTPVETAPEFWDAEGYHQDYYLKNPIRYRFYRSSCGRDDRVEELWGEAAYQHIDH